MSNPVATFWLSSEMSAWLGKEELARNVERGCEKGVVTADLGEAAKTVDVTKAVIEEIKTSYGKASKAL